MRFLVVKKGVYHWLFSTKVNLPFER